MKKDILQFFTDIRSNNKWFLIISALVFVLILVLTLINGRFQTADFGVYYYACKAMLAKEQVYGVAFGDSMTGFYKYSPSILFNYSPASLFGFKLAAVINYLLQSVFTLLTVFITVKIMITYFYPNLKSKNIYLFLVFVLSLTFINRDILLGNVNMFLLFIICCALILSLLSWHKTAGLLLGIAIIFKPYLIVVSLAFLREERFKTLVSAAVSVILLSLIPFLYYGYGGGIEIYREWILAMSEHDSYIISPFTFNSLISNYLFGGDSISLTYYILAAVFIFFLARSVYFLLDRKHRQHSIKDSQVFLFESFTMLALVPNLVNTDIQQFVYAMPLVAYIVIYLIEKKNYVLTITAVLVFFFYTVDQPDLLGRSFAMQVYEYGFRGLSNIALIIFAWVLLLKDTRTKTATTV